MEPIKLHEEKHPHTKFEKRYERLVGLNKQKQQLLNNLRLFFNSRLLKVWEHTYHPDGLNILENALRNTPLILLSGDVGCGKTELASCIGTPLAKILGDGTVRVFETPSDTRGGGLVGELSARITAAFRSAASKLKDGEKGLLIIDEADDLATGRDQQQAHHEDRAGVNALIKEIDRLEKANIPLAVLLITNRTNIMDPAILRRAAATITFSRPQGEEIVEVIKYMTEDLRVPYDYLKPLINLCHQKKPLFSYSDFFTRIARQAIIQAQQEDQPYSVNLLYELLKSTYPSPEIKQS